MNPSTANICFDCEKACGRCSWSKDFTPVPGWTAIEVFRNIDGRYAGPYDHFFSRTYAITACPLFERTPPRKHVEFEWRSIMIKEGMKRRENRNH